MRLQYHNILVVESVLLVHVSSSKKRGEKRHVKEQPTKRGNSRETGQLTTKKRSSRVAGVAATSLDYFNNNNNNSHVFMTCITTVLTKHHRY